MVKCKVCEVTLKEWEVNICLKCYGVRRYFDGCNYNHYQLSEFMNNKGFKDYKQEYLGKQ